MRKIRYIVMNKTKGTHEVAKSKTPKYVIDDDTQELLEIVMNWAQRHVDAQEDDDRFRDMNAELQELGDRFDITRNNIEYEENTSDDGKNIVIKMRIVQDGEERALTPEERRKMIKVVENIPHPNGEIVDIDINENEDKLIDLQKDEEDDEPTKH